MAPVGWFGGKGMFLTQLLPLIPYAKGYIEPFGGGGSVFFARTKSDFEVYNDKFEHLVNLMRVLRDPEKNARLLHLCRYTLYARSEKYYAWDMLKGATYKDDVERAWAFYVTMNMGFAGNFGKTWGVGNTSSGNSGKVTLYNTYNTRLTLFHLWLSRLTTTQIECKDAAEIIALYDNHNHVIYCDPPYIASARKGNGKDYENEMNDAQHEAFLKQCLKAESAVVISGYNNELYQDLLAGWELRTFETVCHAAGKVRGSNLRGAGAVKANQKRTECVWRNKRALDMINRKIGTLF